MSSAIRQSITETFGFEPICINSALVSAQNRQRLYWCGIRQADGTYRRAQVEQPEDRGILLKDILETGEALFDKAYTIAASYYKGAGNDIPRQLGGKSQYGDRAMVAEPVCVRQIGRNPDDPTLRIAGLPTEQRFEARADYKTNTLTTVAKDNLIAEPISSIQVGALPRPNGELSTSQAFRVYSVDAKSVTLKGCGGGAGGKTGLYAVPTNGNIKEKKLPIYEVKDGMITVKGKQYPIKLVDGYYIIRKLTVRECMRLQTVPEWYEFPVSDTQAYKMLGNGWTVEVIAHLIRSIKKDMQQSAPQEPTVTIGRQMTIYDFL